MKAMNAQRCALPLVEGDFYAVRDRKRWIPARYGGYDANLIRNGGRHGAHMFLGIGEDSGIYMDTIEDDKIRKLSPAAKQSFVELEAEYWRGHNAHIEHIKHWLDEQRFSRRRPCARRGDD